MHPNIADRKKPELPKHLELFRILYNSLDVIPVGPKYLGNYEFAVDRLSADLVQYVKENRNNFTITQMVSHLATEYGVFVRSEGIAFYYYRGKGEKLWQVTRTEYVKAFEKRNNVKHQGSKSGILASEFYKPFIKWCIENGYEYFQVAKVLGYAPGTIRRWANEYGYREYVVVRSKQPDLKGKENRVERLSEQGELEFENTEATPVIGRPELKLPKEVKDFDDSIYLSKEHQLKTESIAQAHDDFVAGKISLNEALRREAEYGYLIRAALNAGHKVTITIEPTIKVGEMIS